jgi:uncharacterized membrane protein
MRLLRGLLAVGYPFLIFGGLRVASPRVVALGLTVLFGLRAATRWHRPTAADLRRLAAPALLVGGVLLATGLADDARLLLIVPVLVNAALLIAFARTLSSGPTMVETFARLQVPDLPDDEVRYCRSVTRVWCAFFVANGAVCLWLALAGTLWQWTLYTGFWSYVAIGSLYAVEFVIRARRFGRYEGTLLEPLFRRLFPHGPAA